MPHRNIRGVSLCRIQSIKYDRLYNAYDLADIKKASERRI